MGYQRGNMEVVARRKRHLPDKCPRCNAVEPRAATELTVGTMLTLCYSGWQKRQYAHRDPFKSHWYATCFDCIVLAESALWKYIQARRINHANLRVEM